MKIERGVGKHGLDLRHKIFQHSVCDPAEALEPHFRVRIADKGSHPLLVIQIDTSHGHEGPDTILG